MAYTAIARKWRPTDFSELTGQDHVGSTIRNAICEGRLHHAFLFTGTRGVGKTTAARILAKTINCTEGDPGVPCGKCVSCAEVTSGSSLDVLEIDGASHNGVGDVRELIEQVRYAPMKGHYRVIVIDEVHMLSKAAFNALLKTLEEPPAHVIFIFATTEANRIPPTILSRVLRFDFKRIGPKHVAERLAYIAEKENIQVEDAALRLLSEKADGSMRDGLTLFDQVYSFSSGIISEEAVRTILGIPPDSYYLKLLEAFREHDLASCFDIVEEFYQAGIEVLEFCDGFARFLRDLIYSRVPGVEPHKLGISTELFEKLAAPGKTFQVGDLMRFSRILSETRSVLRHAAMPRIELEMTLVRMAYLDRVSDLQKVLSNSAPEPSEKKKP